MATKRAVADARTQQWARQQALLLELLAQPTAPFREHLVKSLIGQALERTHVPFFEDPAGNLVAGVDSRAGYLRLARERSQEPLRLFIAHMDHPGFHGQRWAGPHRLEVRWLGGAPVAHLNGARMWVADEGGYVAEGRLARVRLAPSRRTIASAELHFEATDEAQLPRRARALYGGFGFRAPVWRSGRRLYTKAADDLVGVFVTLVTAQAARASRRVRPPFIGLLTRAEEVGFVGALGHFDLGWLQRARRPVVAVSLETSRTLQGARVGAGPVVRLGDRRGVFDPNALQVLTTLAARFLPQAHQRRIMDGGTCEATAALAYGVPAIGISVPLGNYHNEGFEGGPDCAHARGPAPEFVDLGDVEGMRVLCQALLRPGLPWSAAWETQREQLRRNARRYRALL